MNRKQDQEDAEFDSFYASLRERFQRMVPATTERDDVNAIWDAMRTELQSDVINIHQSNKAICVAGKSYLNFGNTLVLAAACCLVAFSSIFMVAAKQQSDGTVLSSTTNLERMTTRQQKGSSTNPQWLPEEKELWKQLMAQTATNIDPDSTVVVAPIAPTKVVAKNINFHKEFDHAKIRSLLKRGLLAGLLLLAVGFAWISWMNYAAGQRVTAMRETIVQAGYPIHLKEYYKESITDQENAYQVVQKWNTGIQEAELAVSGSAKEQPPYLSERVLTQEEIAALDAILAKHQVMIEELIQASESKRLRVPADIEKVESVLNELLTRTREFRSISRILSAHVRLKIGQGKQTEAMDSAVAILKWSQLLAKQPTLVSYLVATAVRGIGIYYAAEVLYAGPVDDEHLKKLEDVLLLFDTNEQWKSVIFSEIPFFVDVFHPTLPIATRHLWFSLQGEADYLYTMKTIAEKQLVQNGLFVNAMPDKDSNFGKSSMFGSIMPALNATQEAAMRTDAQTRCLLALLQWRKLGGTAQDIQALNLSGAWAKDPYDGGPLKMQTTEFGPVFYVIGSNRVDDGGGKAILSQQKDVGLMPMAKQAQLLAEAE